MAGKNQHVVPHGDDWAVRGEGNERATSIHPTRAMPNGLRGRSQSTSRVKSSSIGRTVGFATRIPTGTIPILRRAKLHGAGFR